MEVKNNMALSIFIS